jgi:hypothetical protein
MNNVLFSPLSLEKLCINKILYEVWKDNFRDINDIDFLLEDKYWREEFEKRHEIIKWCLKKNNNL